MNKERNNVTLSPKRLIRDYLKNRGLFRRVEPEYSVHCPLGSHVFQGYFIRRYQRQKATLHCDQRHLFSSAMLSYGSDYVFFLAREEATGEGGKGGGLQFP